MRSPSANDSSPSFSASKSYKARQHGCWGSATAEAAECLEGVREECEVVLGGGGLESSSSESGAEWVGALRGMGLGRRSRGALLVASNFVASRRE